jgi:hypothetical protein
MTLFAGSIFPHAQLLEEERCASTPEESRDETGLRAFKTGRMRSWKGTVSIAFSGAPIVKHGVMHTLSQLFLPEVQ